MLTFAQRAGPVGVCQHQVASQCTQCRLKGERGDRIKRGWVGLGVLVALTVFAYGYENGCQTAEILAINDEGDQPCSHVTGQWQPCNHSSAGATCWPL